jgi:hypothetical protein
MKGSGFGSVGSYPRAPWDGADGPGLGDAAGPQAARADCSGIGAVAGPGAPVADRGSLWRPPRQRHTGHRVWTPLTAECGAVVAESTVRAYVAQVRAELEDHLGKVTVPQSYGLGDEAEVDFGLFGGYNAGVLEPLWMFCVRLSASGRGYHEAFGNQAIESFLEGHVHAFDISGVCRRPSSVWIRPPPTTTTTCRIGVQAIRTAPHIPLSTAALTPVNAGGHEGIGA